MFSEQEPLPGDDFSTIPLFSWSATPALELIHGDVTSYAEASMINTMMYWGK